MDDKTGEHTPFWKSRKLSEMSDEEWESLCDGCGRCCLIKLEDEDTRELYHTSLSCHLLDLDQCRCSDYGNRHKVVPDCIRLTPERIESIAWLPDSCAYRLISEGRDLYWWHPLVSGDTKTVHEAGVSVKDWALNEEAVPVDDQYKYIIETDE